ncbi:hypothetical protein PFNF135_03361 [Plasmodium falciparum NF135/5.C10]|uniref:Uncharacterized protein n=1 Tax=Plasmodium falciparum NF135/5.C10 TaxID=1036726 RepID=W4IFB0_PLAFA|nr:hypothetical protein PFNF135_03361 [Plasmodium falciparum NF135/5.C10]
MNSLTYFLVKIFNNIIYILFNNVIYRDTLNVQYDKFYIILFISYKYRYNYLSFFAFWNYTY